MKRIILCADDYGQNSTISQAIIELFKMRRISATSCMTNAPFWLSQASFLKPFLTQADIGLHFNLTEGAPLSKEMAQQGFGSLLHVLLKTHVNGINRQMIEAELHAQIDQFMLGTGRMPDFIDGHQHIHHMPVIRDVILSAYHDRLKAHGAYIRCVHDKSTFWRTDSSYIKRLIIQLSGAASFKKMLSKHKIPHNSSFSGVYMFSNPGQYQKQFCKFLADILDNGIIMCHPGLKNEIVADQDIVDKDIIASSRFTEYHYFQSEQFLMDCERFHVRITRFNHAI